MTLLVNVVTGRSSVLTLMNGGGQVQTWYGVVLITLMTRRSCVSFDEMSVRW